MDISERAIARKVRLRRETRKAVALLMRDSAILVALLCWIGTHHV